MSGKITLGDRLRHLHAMMGSSNRQEHETARAKILELLAKHRKTWNDLIELMSAGGKSPDPSWNVEEDEDDQPTAGDAIHAGLPGKARKPPNVLEYVHWILEQFIDMKPQESIAAALWVLHTHVFQRFGVSPRLER